MYTFLYDYFIGSISENSISEVTHLFYNKNKVTR